MRRRAEPDEPEPTTGAEGAGTANSLDGTVQGPVLQVGAIHGDVHVASNRVTLPRRLGAVPRRVEGFQHRPAGAKLVEALNRPDLVRTGVLVGLGGVGKTQLAADYAERTWETGELDLLIWVNAVSREAVTADYAQAAAQLLGADDSDPGVAAAHLVTWLAETRARWLVVLDDVSLPKDLNGLWPPHARTGRVVATTRRRDAALRGTGRHFIEVGLFTPEESAAYISAKLSEHAALGAGSEGMAARLGHLPLALAQAVAYVIDRQLSCAQYVQRFTDTRRRLTTLLPDAEALPDEHRHTVAATWALSLEHADRLDPVGLAGPVLRVASLLDPGGVPLELFATRTVLNHLAGAVGRNVWEEQARDAMTCLARLSLVDYDPESRHGELRTHELVQRATRDLFAEEVVERLPRLVADALLEAWPTIESNIALSQALRANAAALEAVAEDRLWEPKLHPLLLRVGQSLGDVGQFTAARDHFERLWRQAEQRLGSDHHDTLAVRSLHAFWTGHAGDHKAAVTALERLLADQVRVLGPDHRSTLATRGELTTWIAEVRDWVRLEVLLDDEPSVGYAVPMWEGNLADAVTSLRRVLADQQRLLGPDHPDVLITRGRLARRQGEAGHHEQAVKAFEELLVDHVRTHGADHVDTLSIRNNLALARGENNEPRAAVAELRRLVEDYLRLRGHEHPETWIVRNNLAYWQAECGELEQAVATLEQVVAAQLHHLGTENPVAMTIRGHYGRRLGEAGREEAAVSTFEKLLEDRLRVAEPDHYDTSVTRCNLSYWRYIAGRHRSR
ncbi:MAG: tetratricopeptide repeat protein [Saccharothrix sp.]|nr:tetratricopeptide repeat protein [Saccharothrix sp.]